MFSVAPARRAASKKSSFKAVIRLGRPMGQPARARQTTRLTPERLPVHSFHSLLADLATLARNTVITAITPNYPLTILTRPTPIQHKAFTLLGVPV